MEDNRELTDPLVVDQSSFRIVTAKAVVEEIGAKDELSSSQLEAVKTASWMPMVVDGEPVKLRVTAWMCHEGRNDNGLSFRPEDLGPAAAKIGGQNLLPMDWNHAAVFNSDWDPKAIGVWYTAEAKWNPKAKEGKGALGIEAKGIVWAWAFKDKAKEMLAMQQMNGEITFSMACIPGSSEYTTDEDGRYTEIAKEPVFFSLSALDIAPGDKDATGTVDNMEEMKDMSRKDGYLTFSSAEVPMALANLRSSILQALQKNQAGRTKGETMDETTKELVRVAQQAAEDLRTANEALKQEAEELNGEVKTANDKIADLEIKIEGITTEFNTANARIEELTKENELLTAQLKAFQDKEAAAAVEARWAARYKSLPESYRVALDGRSEEDRKKFVERWSTASDEAWENFQSDLSVVAVASSSGRPSYLELSRKEGMLPSGSGDGSSISARVAALKKS